MEIFSDGHLSVWDKEDLIKAEHEVDPSKVSSLRVGAKCYSEIGMSQLYERIARYNLVTKVTVADDRINDADMSHVKKEFERLFPDADFEWSYDLLVAGKHGR
ncbi:hypothetical protein VIBNISO65_980062 [Vibrio nigripulchritudo SO65]|uniref:hypothetical protein n=1 Tax=Vibrio nigripulchritudo TaxID=28173 RepID=UPI0003B20653|nr:hypothetical protein [Vibrio nigripulchritudo]CCN34289.1 hypothetical protein VIBNIAM115_1450016 [Vibrio nigripulchritudo AM115]CCN43895.1 hypothetical protein VIBNIFTn2_660016 [Vibrio nigripulchritudo FTn2]CCN62751.1 hypothetical protein VIBNIPon4_100016 [Vibrio nigripulchritudo POn4]CCN79616.1 hypothetical protein VIBNISO65_980062 [Vibrio nigripulchritudo SO65]